MSDLACAPTNVWNPLEATDEAAGVHPFRLLLPLLKGYRATFEVSANVDLFDPRVSTEVRDRVFAVMLAAQLDREHQFTLLTRHAGEMQRYLTEYGATLLARWAAAGDLHIPEELFGEPFSAHVAARSALKDTTGRSTTDEPYDGWALLLPLKNVALGVHVETQGDVDERVPMLNDTPAAARFVHAAMVEPLDFSYPVVADRCGYFPFSLPVEECIKRIDMLDVIQIAAPASSRDDAASWVDQLISACRQARVPYVVNEDERSQSQMGPCTRRVQA